MSPGNTSLEIFTYCGIWRPQKWTSKWKCRLYNIYTGIVIFLVSTMPLAQIIQLVLSVSHDETSVDNMYMMMMMMYECGKIATMIGFRRRIIQLLAAFNSNSCHPRNSDERAVQQNSYRLIRIRNNAYGLLIVITVIALSITFFTLNVPERTVPYKMWLPFNVTTDFVYGLVFAEEYASLLLGASIAIGYDTFLFGIILQICAQFDLLKCRIANICSISVESASEHELGCSKMDQEKTTKKRIADCVEHHLQIYQLADEANRILGPVILLSYMTGSVVLCLNIYKISQIKGFNMKMASLLLFSSTSLLQMFMLCYTGSELVDKNKDLSDAIHNIAWYTLSKSNNKSLLIMMTCNSKPITFTCATILHVSLKFFVSLVQFIYSSYACLKHMS